MRRLLLSVCWLIFWANSCSETPLLADAPVRAVMLDSNELNESSGVAQTGPLIWTHNDSGDAPRLFAFSHEGALRGQFSVRGAQAVDWEDMCAFERDGKRYLAVGDIGDNLARRKTVTVYVIAVPESLLSDTESLHQDPSNQAAVQELAVAATFEVNYPTGPINSEALAYDPLSQSFLLATKELILCRLYRVPAPTLSGTHRVQAEFTGSLVLPLVTGGDISPDGKLLVLCTYGPGYLMQRRFDDYYQPADWSTRGQSAAQIFALPTRRQGESIGFSEDGQRLWLTSEDVPTPLFNLPVPTPR